MQFSTNKIRISFLILSMALIVGCINKQKSNSIYTSQNTIWRKVAESKIDLTSEFNLIQKELDNSDIFNLQTCPTYLDQYYSSVMDLEPSSFDYESTKQNWLKIYNQSWNLRIQLHQKIEIFFQKIDPNQEESLALFKQCAESARTAFRSLRYVEDYLAENFSGVKSDYVAGDVKASAVKTAGLKPFQGSAPDLVVNSEMEHATIRSGDIILSRGNAYSSAAIARIGKNPAQFSHMALIYIENDGQGQTYTVKEALSNPRVKVVEAHIEIGTTVRPLQEYFDDGNARNLLLRLKTNSPEIPHLSAKHIHDFIQKRRENAYNQAVKKSFNPKSIDKNDVNFSVPYDFGMKLLDSKELFCSEIGFAGYESQNFKVPFQLSDLTANLDIANRLGITSKTVFAPGDMEIDPRFEIIAEFRNIRKLEGLRIKDQVLDSMYIWMSQKNYKFYPLAHNSATAIFAWLMRQSDFNFIKRQIPKNMNITKLNTIFTLDTVASRLEIELAKKDSEFRKANNGLSISRPTSFKYLESIRSSDAINYKKVQMGKSAISIFHEIFRP
jgi:hypothetical protein